MTRRVALQQLDAPTAPLTLPIPAQPPRPPWGAIVARGALIALLTVAAVLTLAAWIAPIVAARP